MSDGRIIEGRIAAGRRRTVCVLTGVEARVMARRYPGRTVVEAVRLESERDAEHVRRQFVRRMWENAR
jgi:hypothetical protein